MAEKQFEGNREGGYVFISHSHLDIDKVRILRNRMEEEGFEPLCFYLKCLTEEDEITGLIQREIDAREWFVYVDSKNARNSDWVAKERTYIDGLSGKKILHVNLNHCSSMESVASLIMRCQRVVLSYAQKDAEIARRFRKIMVNRDLQVFWGNEESSLTCRDATISGAICQAAKAGCVVCIITKHSVVSGHQLDELIYAEMNQAYVCPIVLGNVELPSTWRYHLMNYNMMHMEENPSEEQIVEVVRDIEQILMSRYTR